MCAGACARARALLKERERERHVRVLEQAGDDRDVHAHLDAENHVRHLHAVRTRGVRRVRFQWNKGHVFTEYGVRILGLND